MHKEFRKSAAEALGAIGKETPKLSEQFIPQLGNALKDTDEKVRQEAARALGAIGQEVPEKVVRQLKEALDIDSSREAAAVALGAIGREKPDLSKGVIAKFVSDLKNPDKEVRQAAAGVLGAIGKEVPKQVLPQLTKALRSDSSREAAVVALGAMGQAAAKAAPYLTRDLKSSNKDLRKSAAEALGAIGRETPEISEMIVQVLKSALRDQHDNVRKSAAGALGAIGQEFPQQVMPQLKATLSSNSGAKVRIAAADALRASGQAARDAKPELSKALRDGKWEVRVAAALAIEAAFGQEAAGVFQDAGFEGDRYREDVAPYFLAGKGKKFCPERNNNSP